MNIGIKVGDLMTRNFIRADPEMDLAKCAKRMIKKRVGSLVITEGDVLRGILTEKDIVYAVVKKSKKGLRDIKARDLMKRKVVTINPSADVIVAMEKFKKKKLKRLPVVEGGKVIGLITMKDILKVDPGLFQMIIQSTKIREQTGKLKRSLVSRGKEGICEECGEYDILYRDSEGSQLVCEECLERR